MQPVEDDPRDRPAERFAHHLGSRQRAEPKRAKGAVEDLIVGHVGRQLPGFARRSHALEIATSDRREHLLLPNLPERGIVLRVGE
jgi:hypothetical protein